MRGAAQESSRAHCPVCCGDLELKIVYCARCSTPHHGECWQFTGLCAIYACASAQFTETQAGPDDEVVIVDEALDPPSTPKPARRTATLPVPAPASVPARRPEGEVAQLAQSKRAAFRHWLRELLDEGLSVPRLWSGAPVVQRRMRLPDQEHEERSRMETRGLVYVLLAMLPFIALLVLFGQPSWWVLFEIVAYLGLVGALHYASTPFHRELIVDSTQAVMVELVGGPLGRRRQNVCTLPQAAAVALAVEGDATSGLDAGVVLLDSERRPIPIPGMLLARGIATDADVRRARATARFLGLTFAGAVDGRGRRCRLPDSDGTAPGSD